MYFITINYNMFDDISEFIVKEVDFIKEHDNYYLFNEVDENIPVYLRSGVVYKDDSEDVLSCGYNVLNYCVGNFDMYEGYCYCICLDIELGKSLLKKYVEETITKKINFYNNILNKTINNINNINIKISEKDE